MSDKKQKKSKKERKDELRDDGFKKGRGVDYTTITDKRVDDKRHERTKDQKLKLQEMGVSALKEKEVAPSSTFDAFQRMAAGLESRKIADKIADPNRPTWEQYKKDNEDKLNMGTGELRKMAEYRSQLDRERELKLTRPGGKRSSAISDSEDEENGDEQEVEDDREKSKKRSKKHKKHKKHKKEKKSKSSADTIYTGESDSLEDSEYVNTTSNKSMKRKRHRDGSTSSSSDHS